MRQGTLPADQQARHRDGAGAQRTRGDRREHDEHHPPGRVHAGHRRRRGRTRLLPWPHPRDPTTAGGHGGRQRLAGRTCILCACRYAAARAAALQRRQHAATGNQHGSPSDATHRDQRARAVTERTGWTRPSARCWRHGRPGRLRDAVARCSRTGRPGRRDRAALELAGRALAARFDRDGRERHARYDDAGRGAGCSDGRADPVRAAFEDSPGHRRRAGKARRSLDLRRRSARGRKSSAWSKSSDTSGM